MLLPLALSLIVVIVTADPCAANGQSCNVDTDCCQSIAGISADQGCAYSERYPHAGKLCAFCGGGSQSCNTYYTPNCCAWPGYCVDQVCTYNASATHAPTPLPTRTPTMAPSTTTAPTSAGSVRLNRLATLLFVFFTPLVLY